MKVMEFLNLIRERSLAANSYRIFVSFAVSEDAVPETKTCLMRKKKTTTLQSIQISFKDAVISIESC